MQSLAANEVRLLDGLFKERETVNRNYLMELDNRALLQNFYAEAGIVLPELQIVEDPAASYLHWGWEAPTCQLRGHFLGHFLSAASKLAASNNDRELEAKVYVIIDELKKCQDLNGGKWVGSIPEKFFHKLERGEYIWSPQYTVHKTLMGLLDAYVNTGYKLALEIIDSLSDWYVQWVDSLTDTPWVVVKGEAGGMLEIWARLYKLTGEAKYLSLAKSYSIYSNFTTLEQGGDALTNNHANATIPEAHGAAMMYEATGDEKWLNITKLFWKCAIIDRESYVTGGQNAGEFWITPGHFYEAMGDRNQEFCTMYNMVRLADYLLRFTGDSEYSDYIERALYNAFASQQNKITGMPTYFLPLRAGSRKKWGTKRHDFWCCHGTMVQAQTLYPSLCYYKNDIENTVWIQQYIPSKACFTINNKTVQISQTTDMSYSAGVLFDDNNSDTKSRWMIKINVTSQDEITLKFRMPEWTQNTIYVDGKKVEVFDGYYSITKAFDNEDISIFFPSSLHTQGLSDNNNIVAIMDGPIALAATGKDSTNFSLDNKDVNTALTPFVEHTYDTYPWSQNMYTATDNSGQILFKPLYDITDESYTVYVAK